MKVIHFIASIDKTGGGTTAYMKLISEELAKYKVSQIIVSGSSENPVEIYGVKVQLFNSMGLTPFHFSKKKQIFKLYISLLKIENPDIVHINGLWNYENSLFQKAAQVLNIKVILSPHGMLEPYILNRNPLKKKLALFLYQNESLKKADYIHTTAETESNQIKKLGYHNASVIIPNGIDTSVIPEKRWNSTKQKTKNLLFLSRLHPKKGIDILIEAVSKLKQQNIKITIAGNGEEGYVDELKQLAASYKVSDVINFTGPIYGKEKWKLYAQSDVFVLPTHSENFGIVIAEALHVGLPVLTTKGTPWAELNTFKCGWWIDLSVNNLVNVLEEIGDTDLEILQEMGENGRHLIHEKYTIQRVTKAMHNFYNTCINN